MKTSLRIIMNMSMITHMTMITNTITIITTGTIMQTTACGQRSLTSSCPTRMGIMKLLAMQHWRLTAEFGQ